jgi:hypothetical protein
MHTQPPVFALHVPKAPHCTPSQGWLGGFVGVGVGGLGLAGGVFVPPPGVTGVATA